MEEEEEEDEEEKQIELSKEEKQIEPSKEKKSNQPQASSSQSPSPSDELKEQLKNRDRPTNPMRNLENSSPNEEQKKLELEERPSKEGKSKHPSPDSKEGILIMGDNAQDSDSNDNSLIKDELEGSIGDSKSGRNSKEPEKDSKVLTNELESAEKSDDGYKTSGMQLSDTPEREHLIDYDMLLEKLPDSDQKPGPDDVEKSENSFEREVAAKRFPTLSDEEHDFEYHKKQASPAQSDGNRDDLKTEDLGIKEPTSSAKKRDKLAEDFVKTKPEQSNDIHPFEFSEDSKSEPEESKDQNSQIVDENFLQHYEQFLGDVSLISRSKSEEWGGNGYKDYNGSDDGIQPMKLHYTEGDLSNIELVEEESEGEESEITNNSTAQELDGAFSDRIQIAQ